MAFEDLTYPEHFRGHAVRLLKGESRQSLGLNKWQITDEFMVLGQGRKCFDAAVERLLTWQAHHSAGVKVRETGENRLELRFGPTLSPCLILDKTVDENSALLVYGTLPGHVESGEEAFFIRIDSEGTVTGRCVAFSRPSWIWARIGKPVARLVQLYITRRYLQGMKSN